MLQETLGTSLVQTEKGSRWWRCHQWPTGQWGIDGPRFIVAHVDLWLFTSCMCKPVLPLRPLHDVNFQSSTLRGLLEAPGHV